MLYAVIPAHTLFSVEANERFRTDTHCVGRIRSFVDSNKYNHKFVIKCPSFDRFNADSEPIENFSAQVQPSEERITFSHAWSQILHEEPFSPAHPPLIGYRYKFQTKDAGQFEARQFETGQSEAGKSDTGQFEEHKRFMNDSALLPIPADKRDEAIRLQKELDSFNIYRQAILQKTSYKELQEYHRCKTRVMVHDFLGMLDPTVDIEQDVLDGKALKLTFVLKEGYEKKLRFRNANLFYSYLVLIIQQTVTFLTFILK